ncbi:transporter substrate-binding domain-containing protein [Vibrio sp. ZSDE26]|uniref:Transporter substrate-binding domain-containing protein n=1 Tax=Vibrio amylolyticus TaxID=2847292 RepID=A0A9X2BGH9_9VIBR|nr:transporter substrate-binding domain-containing protein [Vibrio amylolyticus]MCK6262879.1 transporter substrate-binding domain-containing protein [Vibrio amylolyticus]
MTVRLILLALCFISFSSLASNKVIFATQAIWPPYVFNNPNSGLAVDIVKAAYESQGYHLDLQVKPWLRALKEVNTKHKDALISIWWADSRTENLAFSVPYLLVQLKFIVLKENKFHYSGLSSLNGMKVGVIEDHGYDTEFTQSTDFRRIAEPNLETNIRKLKAKRVDTILADERAARYTIKTLGLDIDDFHFVDLSLIIKPIHLAISKQHPDKDRLLVTFMIGLHTIKQNGIYDSLLEKYY